MAYYLAAKNKINFIVKLVSVQIFLYSLCSAIVGTILGCGNSDSWDKALNRQLHSNTSVTEIDTGLYNFVKKYHVPAISVAAAKNDQLIYLKSFGLANLSDGIEPDSQSLFRIVESSMAITSLAIKKLIAEGRIRYDSKVFGDGGILGFQYGKNRYSEWLTKITIGDLLSNKTGGWSGEDDMIADRSFREFSWSKDSVISWVLDQVPLKSAPGDSSRFSEFDYFVLGRVIEKLSGMPYENYVKENILLPAGITDMELGWDSAGRPHEVAYYFPTTNSIEDRLFQPRYNGKLHENLYLSNNDASLGWVASAADLVKLMIKYRDLNSLKSSTAISIQQSSLDSAKHNNGYDFDWCSTDSTHDWTMQFQFLGSSTVMMRSHGFCWAILINTFRPGESEFFPDLVRIIKAENNNSAMWQPIVGR